MTSWLQYLLVDMTWCLPIEYWNCWICSVRRGSVNHIFASLKCDCIYTCTHTFLPDSIRIEMGVIIWNVSQIRCVRCFYHNFFSMNSNNNGSLCGVPTPVQQVQPVSVSVSSSVTPVQPVPNTAVTPMNMAQPMGSMNMPQQVMPVNMAQPMGSTNTNQSMGSMNMTQQVTPANATQPMKTTNKTQTMKP